MPGDVQEKGPEPEFLKASEAGKLIGVSSWVLYDLKRRGVLRAYSIAGSSALRFARADVLALMQPTEHRSRSERSA
jgi:hypothetical protein